MPILTILIQNAWTIIRTIGITVITAFLMAAGYVYLMNYVVDKRIDSRVKTECLK